MLLFTENARVTGCGFCFGFGILAGWEFQHCWSDSCVLRKDKFLTKFNIIGLVGYERKLDLEKSAPNFCCELWRITRTQLSLNGLHEHDLGASRALGGGIVRLGGKSSFRRGV